LLVRFQTETNKTVTEFICGIRWQAIFSNHPRDELRNVKPESGGLRLLTRSVAADAKSWMVDTPVICMDVIGAKSARDYDAILVAA